MQLLRRIFERNGNINGAIGCKNLPERRVAVPTDKEERVSDVPMNESEQVTD